MPQKYFILLLCINYSFQSFSQSTFNITGKVFEKSTSIPMEYCTIGLHNSIDSSVIDGTVTNNKGFFSIQSTMKKIYITVSYIGFETKTIKIDQDFNLGIIYLKSQGTALEDVEILAEKTTIRYEIDKKIIDVGQDISATNGTAIDALENAPSVDVDINGNVKLRGSGSFLVLINGKPSILSGSEALRQIPASNIKNIELITNPSAKYDAGTTGGIINIILKDEKRIGTSGMINFGIGTFKNHNAKVALKHNIKKWSFNFNASLYQRNSPSKSIDSTQTFFNENINIKLTERLKSTSFSGYRFKYSIKYNILKNHSIDFNFRLGKWMMFVNNEEAIEEYDNSTFEKYKYISIQDRASKYYGPSISYQGEFKNKSSLSAYLGFSKRGGIEKDFDEKINYTNNQLLYKAKAYEKGDRTGFRAKIDYSIPIKTAKLEFGGKARISWKEKFSTDHEFDLLSNEYYLTDNVKDMVFSRKVYGLYGVYSNKWKKISFSLGFRAEYIDREIEVKNEANYNYYKWDYFPSTSLAYTINEKSKLYASFSKRINRNESFMIEPITIRTGADSYYKGNPNLRPEKINSSEIGYTNTFKTNTSVSVELFHKHFTDLNRWFTYSYGDSVSSISQPINIGSKHELGLESSLNFKPLKWWKIDLSATAFYINQEGKFRNTDFAYKSLKWNVRFNNNFTITKNTKVQFTAKYKSPIKSAINNFSGNMDFSLGIKQSFYKKALNLTFNIRNLFYTNKNHYEIFTEDIYRKGQYKQFWPFLNLGISYKINNYKQNRNNNEREPAEF